MKRLHKYPRTTHIEGSRLQPGDETLADVPLRELAGRHLVIEEKIDGANCGVSFDQNEELHVQSRGHFLTGGPREKHFAMLKTWASANRDALWARLGTRFVAYGEWVFAKHTIFYDRLPHFFLEFDVLDTERGNFLSTERRREMWSGSPVTSVPVLTEGAVIDRRSTVATLREWVRPSLYKSEEWREALFAAGESAGVACEVLDRETDRSDLAEGLYIKVEEEGRVVARHKFIRASFLTAVVESESHWLARPIVRNVLAPGVDLFGADS